MKLDDTVTRIALVVGEVACWKVHTQANYRTTRMSLITFIPIPTKFVGAGIPVGTYRSLRCGSSRGHSYVFASTRLPSLPMCAECKFARTSVCTCTTSIRGPRFLSLLKSAIEDNPQIDRNLDDKASLVLVSGFTGSCTIHACIQRAGLKLDRPK